MIPGNYYVGDLCYVMSDKQWDEICSNDLFDGVFTLSDGTVIAQYGTAYGDGVYEGSNGKYYGVDSGTIGCVLVESISEKYTKEELEDLGSFETFDDTFSTGFEYERGTIRIGHIRIETSADSDD